MPEKVPVAVEVETGAVEVDVLPAMEVTVVVVAIVPPPDLGSHLIPVEAHDELAPTGSVLTKVPVWSEPFK